MMNVWERKRKEAEIYWDESQIISDEISYLMEEEDYSEDEAIKIASENSFVLEDAWEFFKMNLDEMLEKVTSRFYHKVGGKYDKAYFYVEGNNLGWRGRSGFKVVEASNGEEFLREILPETNCTFFIFRTDDKRTPEIIINNFHHDTRFAGAAGEWYHIYPMRIREVNAWIEGGYSALKEIMR